MAYIPVSEREGRICKTCKTPLKKQQSKYCSRPCKDRAYRAANYAELRRREDVRHDKRKARKNNVPHTLTESQWVEAKAFFSNGCAYCGKEEKVLHKEHFVPVTMGGGFTADNILPACATCNHKKGTKDGFEFVFENFPNRMFIILYFLRWKKGAKFPPMPASYNIWRI